jgi:hypothetical protein
MRSGVLSLPGLGLAQFLGQLDDTIQPARPIIENDTMVT